MTRRTEPHHPAGLTDEQKQLYDDIVGGKRATGPTLFRLTDDEGRLEGPLDAMLLQPVLGDALQRLGVAVRYATSLDDRCREVAILVVAAVWDSGYERYAHEAVGRAVGLGDDEIAALRRCDLDDVDGAREQAVARICLALARRGDLDDSEYREAVSLLGEATLFELMTLVGYYGTLALQLRVFRVPSPAD